MLLGHCTACIIQVTMEVLGVSKAIPRNYSCCVQNQESFSMFAPKPFCYVLLSHNHPPPWETHYNIFIDSCVLFFDIIKLNKWVNLKSRWISKINPNEWNLYSLTFKFTFKSDIKSIKYIILLLNLKYIISALINWSIGEYCFPD